MIKQSASPVVLHVLCDKCKVIIATDFNFFTQTPAWERVLSARKRGVTGRGRCMDFCTEKCRIIYFRGWKYYQRKLRHMEKKA